MGPTAGPEGEAVDGGGLVAAVLDGREEPGERRPIAADGRAHQLVRVGGSEPGHGREHYKRSSPRFETSGREGNLTVP